MIENLSNRFTGIALSVLVHVTVGVMFLLTLPAGEDGRAMRKNASSGVMIIELLPLNRKAPEQAAPLMTAPTQLSAAPEKPQQPVSVAAQQPYPADNELDHVKAATTSGSSVHAPGGASSAAASADVIRYRDALLDHIGRYRQYPPDARRDGIEGTVWVRFLMARDGKVVRIWIEDSSGQMILDQEATAAIGRAAPLPPIPPGMPDRIDITLPIDFKLG